MTDELRTIQTGMIAAAESLARDFAGVEAALTGCGRRPSLVSSATDFSLSLRSISSSRMISFDMSRCHGSPEKYEMGKTQMLLKDNIRTEVRVRAKRETYSGLEIRDSGKMGRIGQQRRANINERWPVSSTSAHLTSGTLSVTTGPEELIKMSQ